MDRFFQSLTGEVCCGEGSQGRAAGSTNIMHIFDAYDTYEDTR